MRAAKRVVALSALLMFSANLAFAADVIPCRASSPDHKDLIFKFKAASARWRAIIPGNPTGCSQFVLQFKNDTDFTTVPAKMKKLPGFAVCDAFEGKPAAEIYSGTVQVYCVKIGTRIDRYASIVIWNTDPKALPYGAIYSVMGADTETKGELKFVGVAVDAIANYNNIPITLIPETR